MAEKHKHSRENACLSPRERPVSAIFPNALDPSQVNAPEALASTTKLLLLYRLANIQTNKPPPRQKKNVLNKQLTSARP